MKRFNYKGRSASVNSHALHDEGLRQYFLAIYTLMSAGLFITALSAFAVFTIPALTGLMFNISPEGYLLGMTMVGMLISFSPLVISVYFAFKLADLSVDNTRLLFFIFATLMGASLGSLGFIYTGASITKTFLICSSMFGTMSIYGYSTKKDLTSMGSFLFMGLIGLLLTSLINLWLRSPGIEFALSAIGVLIFTGLIAYDTQKLKTLYFNKAVADEKIAIMGALTLYLDFINLFVFLLRFLGQRKR